MAQHSCLANLDQGPVSIRRGRFLNAPTLLETIDLLRDAGSPQTPPLTDLCRYAERLAGEIEDSVAGIPADDIRHFQGLRGRHCR